MSSSCPPSSYGSSGLDRVNSDKVRNRCRTSGLAVGSAVFSFHCRICLYSTSVQQIRATPSVLNLSPSPSILALCDSARCWAVARALLTLPPKLSPEARKPSGEFSFPSVTEKRPRPLHAGRGLEFWGMQKGTFAMQQQLHIFCEAFTTVRD